MGLKIGGSWHPESYFAQMQKYFTGYEASHSFVVVSEHQGRDMILDVGRRVKLSPLDQITGGNYNASYWIFDIPISEELKIIIQKNLYNNYINKKYAYTQISWFVWRRINELVFKKDVRLSNNPFKSGPICSEPNWEALYASGLKGNIPKIGNRIIEWQKDNFHSGDNKTLLYDLERDGVISLCEERYV